MRKTHLNILVAGVETAKVAEEVQKIEFIK